MMYYPRISVFNLPDTSSTSYMLRSNPPDKLFNLKNYSEGSIITYYPHAYASNNHIYILESGKPDNEPVGETSILMYDWQVNLKQKFIIPSKYKASTFLVDELKKEIFVFSYANDAIYAFHY